MLFQNTSIIGFHSEGNAVVLDAWGNEYDNLAVQMENFKMNYLSPENTAEKEYMKKI